nr:protein FAR1-related sequence 5-like [Tanacetum cinerariifolium]
MVEDNPLENEHANAFSINDIDTNGYLINNLEQDYGSDRPYDADVTQRWDEEGPIDSNIRKMFDTPDDAYTFYNQYVFTHVFGIRKHWNYKNKVTNEVYRKWYVCKKEGFINVKDDGTSVDTKKCRRDLRTICEARLRIMILKDGKWWTLDSKYKAGNDSIAIKEINNESRVSALTLWCVHSNSTKAIEQANDRPSEITRLNTILVKFLKHQMSQKRGKKAQNVFEDNSIEVSQVDMIPQIYIRDPVVVAKTKGRPKIATRIKPYIELQGNKKKSCSHYHELGHNITGCLKKRWMICKEKNDNRSDLMENATHGIQANLMIRENVISCLGESSTGFGFGREKL